MSKKDYQAIARALYSVKAQDSEFRGRLTQGQMHDAVVTALADACQAGNARFDRDRFEEACETGKCKGMR